MLILDLQYTVNNLNNNNFVNNYYGNKVVTSSGMKVTIYQLDW